MSAFDQSFDDKTSDCCGMGNDRQAPALQNRLPIDDLMTPEDRQKKREIDDMLSQAITGLTFEERQQQEEILHGVDQKVAEEDTFIEASLQELDRHLSKIKSRSIYEMAEQMDPAYVRDRGFRVMFLRGNRYNVKESAENMLRFFETKRHLFGVNKLVKDITLEDLNAEDIAALKTGFFQVAGKDSSGRILLVNIPGLRGNVALQNELRMRFYILMSALEKEENQLSGFVTIGFSVGNMKDRFGGSGFFENAKVSAAIPTYTAALHLCIDEVGEYLLQLAVLKAVPFLKLRSRTRLHFGSQTECLYHLSTYGIPEDFLPLDPNTGQISQIRHLEWVESRFAMEKHGGPLPTITQSAQSIISPRDNDVLVGTGKASNNLGNQRLRAQVKELSQAYEGANMVARRALVDNVINSVQESGGRFLKEHKAGGFDFIWQEMPNDQIRKNIRQAFRNSYRRRKPGDA